MKNKIFVLVFLLACSTAFAQNSINVLFIGNSYTATNNLPQMISNIASAMGENMTYSSNTPGGCTFMQHCSNASMTMIQQGSWDIVVLQEQSQLPSFPQCSTAGRLHHGPQPQCRADVLHDLGAS